MYFDIQSKIYVLFFILITYQWMKWIKEQKYQFIQNLVQAIIRKKRPRDAKSWTTWWASCITNTFWSGVNFSWTWICDLMGYKSIKLGYEKMWKLGEETTNKVTHTKNNRFGSKYVQSDRYSCIWRWKFAWIMCSSICSHTTAFWNQMKLVASKWRLSK